VIRPRLRLLDTEALAHHHKVAPGTIRRWASEDHWHPYGTRRFRLWSMADAQRSAEKRQPPNEGSDCA
jgi:23S rRNA G2445 N2-methylase RlmL